MFPVKSSIFVVLVGLLIGLYIKFSPKHNQPGGQISSPLFVHVLYRHGDRAPIVPAFSTEADWTVGLGELTNLGKQQQYELGRWLQHRYQHVIGDTYSSSKLYVRSTDTDRTITSALANLAGMFPPKGPAVWNSKFPWNPIPVHTVPVEVDSLLPGIIAPHCDLFDWAEKAVYESDEGKTILENTPELFKFLTEETGRNITNLFDALIVRDAIFTEAVHNKTLPEWAKNENESPLKDLQKLLMWFLVARTHNPLMAKLRAGYLLKDILDRSWLKSQNQLTPNHSMYVFSSHDINIIDILHTLGLFDENSERPPYASALLFEVHVIDGVPQLQIFYKTNDTNAVQLELPTCGPSCPLDTLYTLWGSLIPQNDYYTECYINYNYEST